MSPVSTPQLPPYRITLFYGPEPVAGHPSRVSCVFNVKKRSWKAGVQVVIELDERQLAHARRVSGFEVWLQEVLTAVPEADRAGYEGRAGDLFVQGVCALKLALAIEAGIRQENQSIRAEALARELADEVLEQAKRLKSQVLAELDLAAG
ncbi:MAG: hypothetical protein ACREIK_04370 [Nitrospiraceae bacterium]